jgi:phosphoglycolate phosphatase-like HAD superfamily hydrolase
MRWNKDSHAASLWSFVSLDNVINIFFDLDGTLIDSSARIHSVFTSLTPGPAISFARYWNLKRAGHTNTEIFADNYPSSPSLLSEFERRWMAAIEEPNVLSLDKAFPGIQESLKQLQTYAVLHVCTARQHSDLTLKQISNLGLGEYFATVLSTGQVLSKADLISSKILVSGEDWLVGDTGADIVAAKTLGIQSCGVLTGSRDRRVLARYRPQILRQSATEFCQFIMSKP